MSRPERLQTTPMTNALDGNVVWSPIRSLWLTTMATIAVAGGIHTASWTAATVSFLLTITTLCLGHSVGLHRLLIHRSFRCSRWLEYVMVYAGTLVGMGGPRRVVLMHEMRDWAQRQSQCHPFYIHQSSLPVDGLWNLHCECSLANGPTFSPERAITDSEFYRLLDRYWMAAQLPLALVLYWQGGWAWIVWGICVRVTVSLIGHWLVGYFAHNYGQMNWQVEGASVQGHNLSGLGLLTMGEAWHNNHHAFPESARLGLERGQNDPGWWLLSLLHTFGLVHDLTLPEHLPERPELIRVDSTPKSSWVRRGSLSRPEPLRRPSGESRGPETCR